IWDQSSRRTAIEFGFLATAMHVILFPLEHAGHLFPASLLLLFCFHKGFIRGIKSNPFLSFITLIFLANIWVYWLSPQTRPRYLMMLYPLLFIIWSHAYYSYRDKLPLMNKIFEKAILVLALLVTLAVPAAWFFGLQEYVPYLTFKILLIFTGCALFTWLIFRFRAQKITAFIGLLLMVRLAFSFFVLPHRNHHMDIVYFRD